MAEHPPSVLADALARALPGDTVVLPPGVHAGAVGMVAVPGLTLTSPGPGAELRADGRHVGGKAILVVRAPGVRIENIGFRGARVPDGNGAGIRFESGSLWLERCRFADNEMGLLSGAGPQMQLVVHRCHFGDAPRHDSGQLHHLLYVGRIGSCVVLHSRFGNGWRGHLLKSRARINRVLWSEFIDTPHGEAAYEVEFPEGGDILLQGNRIEQSAHTRNPALLSVGAEARGRPQTRLVLRDNVFVSERGASVVNPTRFVRLWRERLGQLQVDAEGDRFEGPGLIGLGR